MARGVEMEPIPHCRRCGYANAPSWGRCGGCARRLPRPPASSRLGARRSRERKVLGDMAAAGLVVPGAQAALVGAALWGPVGPAQRTPLLLAAAVAAGVVAAGTGLAARQLVTDGEVRAAPVPAAVPVALAPVVRAQSAPVAWRGPAHLSDAELRAAIAW